MPWLLRSLVIFCAGFTLLDSVAGQTPNGSEGPVLRVGFNAAPPLAYFKEDGAPDGQIVRIAQKLLRKTARPAEIGLYPAPRLFKNLQDGELDLSMLVHASELEDCCLFSKTPVMTLVLRAYWLGDRPPIRGKEDVVDKSLIILHGYSYAGLIGFFQDERNGNRLETAKTFAAGLQMLESGRADYLLAYEANIQEVLGQSPPKDLKSEVIGRFPVHLVLNRNYPDAPREMARLEALLKDIEAGR